MAGESAEKLKLKKLIVRFKYLVYVTIGAIGIAMIVYAANMADVESYPNRYTVLMGIGSSIVASALITIILLVLLPDNEEKTNAEELGLEKIHGERKSIKISGDTFPKEKLDFIAFGLSHFRQANRPLNAIVQKIDKGLVIRIMTINPRSLYVLGQQNLENHQEIRQDIIDLIKWVDKIKTEIAKTKKQPQGRIELKIYENLPLDFYCQADDTLYVGPYIPGEVSGKAITYQYSKKSKIGKIYMDLFEKIWSGESTVNIIENYQDYHTARQSDAVEGIIKYFCGLMQYETSKKVIGVIAIFKGEKRRTFYSCNKNSSGRHPCHYKTEGTVGKMLEINSGEADDYRILWCDYTNKLAFIKEEGTRNNETQKIINEIVKIKQDDTVAILAVPLLKEGKIYGTLTFDFAELPLQYENKLSEYKQLKENVRLQQAEVGVLTEMFENAKVCGEIVTNLLGQYVDTNYMELYEEEWK